MTEQLEQPNSSIEGRVTFVCFAAAVFQPSLTGVISWSAAAIHYLTQRNVLGVGGHRDPVFPHMLNLLVN
jgi:hypothetical protein